MQQPYVLVLYYSKHGSTVLLAQHIARGIAAIQGIEARLRTVPPLSALCATTTPTIPDAGAPYVTLDDLEHCYGLALGSPTHFGHMAAPMKCFWDTTSAIWLSGSLVDKPACVFSSSVSMHGGQESTLLSMMIPLLHHGMLVMGLPYTESVLTTTRSGGSPYGATHVALQNTIPLSKEESILAQALGKRLAIWSLKAVGSL